VSEPKPVYFTDIPITRRNIYMIAIKEDRDKDYAECMAPKHRVRDDLEPDDVYQCCICGCWFCDRHIKGGLCEMCRSFTPEIREKIKALRLELSS
jgi:hypothetical protein